MNFITTYNKNRGHTIIIALLLLLFFSNGFAQNGINYKAIIKDSNGNVLNNTSITIRFIIYEGAALTNNVYQENHTVNTDANGLIIVNIGEGITGDDFGSINWANDEHFLNVQIDKGEGLVDLGTTAFKTVPYAKVADVAANVNGLEALDEGNGVGWRLKDRNASNYDNIGSNAVDFSLVNNPALGLGASGNYAFSLGYNNTASGEHALAFGNQSYALDNYAVSIGNNNVVSGLNSTAIGAVNQVSGDYAFSVGLGNQVTDNYAFSLGRNSSATDIFAMTLGENNTASGQVAMAIGEGNLSSGSFSIAMGRSAESSSVVSVAIGDNVEASGQRATALGHNTQASGNHSTVMGLGTQTTSYASTIIGLYNTSYGGNPSAWSAGDYLFVIGNGTSNANRSNALEVYKSGYHSINSTTTGLNINSEYRGLSINNTGPTGISISNGSEDGISVSSPTDTGLVITNAGSIGVFASSDDYGGRFFGDNVGIYASGGQIQGGIPDIILGSSNLSSLSDDGIISTNPDRAGSDMFLRSYDAVVVELDYDNNEAGHFRVRNGNQDVVFEVAESGNVSFDGDLEIGTGIVDSPVPDIRVDSNDDVLIVLDNDNNETGFFGVYNGSVSSSNVVFSLVDSGDAVLSGNLTQLSDRRLKKDIKELSYGLKEVLQLNPKQYYWKDKSKKELSLGLIAQEVKPIIEDIVSTQNNEEETLGVSYIELIPVLIKAIQEQQEIISSQQQQNNLQKAELTALQKGYQMLLSRIETLESSTSN